MDAEGGLCHRLRDVQTKLKGMEEQVRDIIASSGWPPSHLLLDRCQTQGASASSLSRCRECKGEFGSKWLRSSCCWRCRRALRDSGRCFSSNSPLCIVCPHLRACFACDGISCSICGVVRSVAVESDGSLSDWLLELDPQPQTLYLDFDATLCDTASGCAPQIGKHALHVELATIVESGKFQTIIITKQNPQHHPHIVKFLEAVGWKEGREYVLHCIGGTGVSKSSIIQNIMSQQSQRHSATSSAVFVDDSIKEILQARSQLPPFVTMLVFAAAKSFYVRRSCCDVAAPAITAQNFPIATVYPRVLTDDTAAIISPQARAAATKLEQVLGVNVDMSQPADSSTQYIPASELASLPLSSTSANSARSVIDGPRQVAVATTSPDLSTSQSTSTIQSSSAGTFLFSISRDIIAHLILFLIQFTMGLNQTRRLSS